MKKSSIISISIFSLLILSAFGYGLINDTSNDNKSAFIELNKILPEFKLKQELESKLLHLTQERQTIIDSLEFELKVLSKQLQADNGKDKTKVALFEVKKEQYYEKKNAFDEDNTSVAKKYDEQIFSQLNQYVKDFGKKFGYVYIFGADGSGSLMYADNSKNITEEVKKFINERYSGKTE